MSDEPRVLPSISVDVVDDCAPTERDPSPMGVGTPSRGVALSVLWWLEGEGALERAARVIDESERARD
jgi:hypothetical protein